jgi:hypothetical protein
MPKDSITEQMPLTEDAMTWGDGDVLGSVINGANGEIGNSAPVPGGPAGLIGQFGKIRFTPEHLFANSMIARKAVTVIPDQALPLFKGWTQRKKKDGDFESDAFDWFQDQIYHVLLDACYMARLNGDAYVILFFDDGQNLDQPLDLTKVKDFYGAIAKQRIQVNAVDGFNPEDSQLFSVTYTAYQENLLNSRQRKASIKTQYVHRSRILHIPGILLTSYTKSMNNGENASVLGYIEKLLADWEEGNQSGVEMLKSHSAFVIGIKGLAVSVRTKNVGLLTDRFKSILQGINGLKAVIFDSDKEKADVINRTYSGIQPVIKQLDNSLANAIDFPKAYLLNGDTSAFDSSGLGARYEMAQIIDRYYLSHLRKPLKRLFVYYCAWKNKPEKAESFDLDIIDSLKLTREEEGRVRFKNAQTDSLYLVRQDPAVPESSVLNLNTVRTRWESGRYSDEITMVKMSKEDAVALDPPPEDKQSLSNVTKTITSKSGRSAYNGQDVK